ncbi:MAG: DNA-binding response regulator [Microbacteriaceae bacterium]|nr:DNA-binding response regulator [Microbacteriaceae bacterium]HEV7956690.1 response regulator transcription factor [Marisediminicola sp.]
MISVFLVDDHELVRRGLIELLQSQSDITVVGEAATVEQGRTRIAAVRPDVAILDVHLPDGNGVDLCRDVRSDNPDLRCLILTAYDDDEAVVASVVAGASGYVLKDVRGSGLIDALRAVAAGRSLLDAAQVRRVGERLRSERAGDPRLESLSTREREVLDLIADGLTNREIGERLSLAEKTIKNYVSGVLSKLGLQRRTQAAILQRESRPRR